MVRIAGERLSRRPEDERARVRGRLLGVLYQQANLVEHLSVEANVALAQRLGARAGHAAWRAEVIERCGPARARSPQPPLGRRGRPRRPRGGAGQRPRRRPGR